MSSAKPLKAQSSTVWMSDVRGSLSFNLFFRSSPSFVPPSAGFFFSWGCCVVSVNFAVPPPATSITGEGYLENGILFLVLVAQWATQFLLCRKSSRHFFVVVVAKTPAKENNMAKTRLTILAQMVPLFYHHYTVQSVLASY